MRDNFVLERIEQICKRKKLSNYRLAQKSGIHQASLSVLLNRSSTPSVDTLEKICTGLDMTVAQFFSAEFKYKDLSNSQQYVLDLLDSVSEIDKKMIVAYFDGLKKKK